MAENTASKPCCPICEKPAAPRKNGSAFPFCSERCKLADLGKWLDGDYAISGPTTPGYDD